MKTTIQLDFSVHILRIGGKVYPGMRLMGELGPLRHFQNQSGEEVYILDTKELSDGRGFANLFNVSLFKQQGKESDCLVVCGSPHIMASLTASNDAQEQAA